MSDLIMVSRGLINLVNNKDESTLEALKVPSEYINSFDECDDYYNLLGPPIDNFVSIPLTMFIDRFDGMKQPFKLKNICPLPKLTPGMKPLPFDELCLIRANELISTGKVINVAWSGGIDSTCLIVALLMCGIPKDQLIIHGTYISVNENPEFYKNIIVKQGLNHKINSYTGNYIFTEFPEGDELFVSGEAGDQISVNSMTLLKTYDPDRWHKPYIQTLSQKHVDALEPHITNGNNYLPEPLETLVDLNWWIGFNLMYQYIITRQLSAIHDASNWQNKLIPFFDTQEFQTWGVLLRGRDKIKDSVNTYKFQFKDFIYSYDKNEDYWINKLKVQSMKSRFNQADQFFTVLEDGTITYYNLDGNNE